MRVVFFGVAALSATGALGETVDPGVSGLASTTRLRGKSKVEVEDLGAEGILRAKKTKGDAVDNDPGAEGILKARKAKKNEGAKPAPAPAPIVNPPPSTGPKRPKVADVDLGVEGLAKLKVPDAKNEVKPLSESQKTQNFMTNYDWDQVVPSLSKDDVDVGAKGVCAPLFAETCKDVTPGLGRAATCLRARPELGTEKSGKACKSDVNKFFQTIRRDITTFNTGLAKACREELSGICKNAATGLDGDGAAKLKTPFACLKAKRKKLSETCGAAVFQEQVRRGALLSQSAPSMLILHDDDDMTGFPSVVSLWSKGGRG